MRERLGAWTATLFGLALVVVGGRLIGYEYLLTTDGEAALAEITEVGSVPNSSGGYVDYVRYVFTDGEGRVRSGQASGYSGQVGETIRVEYSGRLPAVHRVAGRSGGVGYRWRWAILAVGAVLAFGGWRWVVRLRAAPGK